MKIASLFVLLALAACAQTTWPCEATPAIERELRNPSLTDPQIAFVDRMAAFHELLRKYPDDVFVHRRYQDWLSDNNTLALQEPQLAEYRAAYEKDPTNVLAGYLYARLLVRRDHQKGFAILRGLLEKHPECPWLRLQLAEMEQMPRMRDLADGRKQLDAYLTECPSPLEPNALRSIQSLGDQALWRRTAERMRGQLESRNDAAAISAWPQLWALESRISQADQQEQARRQVAEDVKKIRALQLTDLLDWYNVMRSGYETVNDAEGQKWADDQLLHNMAASSAAFDLVYRQWWKRHSSESGTPIGPEEPRARELLQASGEWIARWPNHPRAWQSRLLAIRTLKDTPPAVVEQVASKVVEMSERSPDVPSGTVPVTLDVAKLRLERGIGIDQIPALIRKADQWIATKYETDRKIQFGVWGGPEYLELFRWTEHWQCQRVLFDFYEKTGKKDNALEALSSMQQSVANVDPKDLLSQAAGWPMIADMAIAAGQLDKARAALARTEALIASNQPKADAKPDQALSFALRDGPYWESAGKLAEAEGRKLDAVAFYLNAKSAGDAEKAHSLWASLGGTASGWDAWLKRSAAKTAPEANAAWQTRDRVLPDFALEDVTGKKIRLADLKGKTIFLNLWATWCGPCREELPQVEELYRTLKERKDVAVVTIDADENPALVKPFLDRSGYSFPVVLGSEYVFKTLGVDSIPRNWIVDKNGVIRMELNSGNRVGMAKDVLPMIEKMKDQ